MKLALPLAYALELVNDLEEIPPSGTLAGHFPLDSHGCGYGSIINFDERSVPICGDSGTTRRGRWAILVQEERKRSMTGELVDFPEGKLVSNDDSTGEIAHNLQGYLIQSLRV